MSEDRQVELLAFGDTWSARRPALAQVATAS
jgi:hypothetical protein